MSSKVYVEQSHDDTPLLCGLMHTHARARAHTHTHTHMRMSTIGGKKNNAVTHTHRRSVSDAHVQELLADGKEAANDARARIALFPMSSKVKMTHHLGLSLSLSLSLSLCVCVFVSTSSPNTGPYFSCRAKCMSSKVKMTHHVCQNILCLSQHLKRILGAVFYVEQSHKVYVEQSHDDTPLLCGRIHTHTHIHTHTDIFTYWEVFLCRAK